MERLKTYPYSLFLVLIVAAILLSACGGIAPATPTPFPGGCNQFGCPYPAVCNQATGQCVISVPTQAQPKVAPIAPLAGQIAANPPGPLQLAPTPTTVPPSWLDCNPPVPSISNVNSFCANPAAKLGGVSFDFSPASPDALNYRIYPKTISCDWGNTPTVCTGPQGATFPEMICSSCNDQGSAAAYGTTYHCPLGMTEDAYGNCNPVDQNNPDDNYSLCPPGSDWDNSKQACVDEKTAALNPQCPPGYPYFNPEFSICLANPDPAVYDCQSFQIPLGECLTVAKKAGKACQPPASGCPINPMTGGRETWDAASCSCK